MRNGKRIVSGVELPSLDLSVDEARRLLETQLRSLSSLHGKHVSLLAADGIILTILIMFFGPLLEQLLGVARSLSVVAAAFLLASAVCSALGHRPRRVYGAPSFSSAEQLMTWTPDETKFRMFHQMWAAFTSNAAEIARLERWLDYSTASFILGLAALFAAFVALL